MIEEDEDLINLVDGDTYFRVWRDGEFEVSELPKKKSDLEGLIQFFLLQLDQRGCAAERRSPEALLARRRVVGRRLSRWPRPRLGSTT